MNYESDSWGTVQPQCNLDTPLTTSHVRIVKLVLSPVVSKEQIILHNYIYLGLFELHQRKGVLG